MLSLNAWCAKAEKPRRRSQAEGGAARAVSTRCTPARCARMRARRESRADNRLVAIHDDISESQATRLTLYVAVVASALWPVAFLALGLRGPAENETPHESAYLNRSALIQVGLARLGLLCAWLARIWARRGWTRHALIAEALVGPLYLAVLVIVLKARLFG